MRDGLNKVLFMGNLAADSELRYAQNGQPVTTFRVASNSSYFANGQRHERAPCFMPVVLWGKRGEALHQKECLLKGQPIYICGRLQNRTFDKQDGTKGYIDEIVVGNQDEDLILLGRGSQTQPPSADAPPPEPDVDDFSE
jgi:single-strand DNA-binding protein